MITNASVTIYNRYFISGDEAEYLRSEILQVKWENRKQANIIQSGLMEADSVVIYIPIEQISSYYVAPIAWRSLLIKTGFFTLQPGDIAVRGIVTDQITSVFRIKNLREKYDDTIKITTVDRYDSGSPSMHHFMLGGS